MIYGYLGLFSVAYCGCLCVVFELVVSWFVIILAGLRLVCSCYLRLVVIDC